LASERATLWGKKRTEVFDTARLSPEGKEISPEWVFTDMPYSIPVPLSRYQSRVIHKFRGLFAGDTGYAHYL
jgi:hypothetical protein